jgi:hypothetical protein
MGAASAGVNTGGDPGEAAARPAGAPAGLVLVGGDAEAGTAVACGVAGTGERGIAAATAAMRAMGSP